MPDDFPCPVCDVRHTDGAALRRHLMVEHRKSDLTELLVADVADSREPRATI